MKKLFTLFLLLVFAITIQAQPKKYIGGLNASQLLHFLADTNQHQKFSGLSPSEFKQFLAGDEKKRVSGVSPSEFWKFFAEAVPVKASRKKK